MNRALSSKAASPKIDLDAGPLKVLLLGPPKITLAGVSLNLKDAKASALLYYLAAGGKTYSRDHLATLLWGETGSREALHSLRSSLYHLRQALHSAGSEGALLSEGEWLSLGTGLFESDLALFDRLVRRADEASLVQAVGLFRGPFLEGFSLPNAPAFEAWQEEEEARLSRSCLDALDRLAGLAEARTDWAAAIGHLQRLAQMDSLNESVQQRLIRAYLRQEEIGLALRQYRHFENQLHQELHLDPSPETHQLLYEALRRQRESRAGESTSGFLQARQPAVLPMIGRNHALDLLNAAARGVQAGRGHTVLVEGEAGIGKTRLIDEFASSLISASNPWLVLQGACSPFDDLLSYGPFLEAFQSASTGDLPAVPVDLDPSLPDTRGRFSWRILQTIRSLTHNLPLMLIIEDLQWANSSTLNLFGFLAMRLQRLPVLLISSVQHADSIPALQRLISLGRRKGELDLLPLAPLTLEGVTALLRASAVEAGSTEDLAEWLYVRSTGSPFLLT